MKIAVTSTGNTMDSPMDSRFGRCPWFLVVETDDMSFTALPNENAQQANGAGIQSASFIANQGVQAILTGKCGPKATQAFSVTDIQILTDYSGTVRQAVEVFKNGNQSMTQTSQPESASAPMNNQAGTPGRGMGMGGRRMGGSGRGMGMGGGKGMGGGGGMGSGKNSGNRS